MLYAFFWVIPWRLNFICRRFGTPSVPSSWAGRCEELFHLFRYPPPRRSCHLKLPKISGEYRLNQKHLESRTKTITITDVSYRQQIPSTRSLILGDGLNLLPLNETNPTDSLGQVKVSQQMDAEMCD